MLQNKMFSLEIMDHEEIGLYEFNNHTFNKRTIKRLTSEWPKDIEDYLRERVDTGSRDSQCKVGFTGIFYSHTAINAQDGHNLPIRLGIRPLTYWITQQFNKEMIAQPANTDLRLFRELYGSKLFKSTEDFQCECPSSLYLEMAVVTSDGYIPKLPKSNNFSVESKRNGGSIFTCGFEIGFSWQKYVDEENLQLNIEQALRDGLLSELFIELDEVEDWYVSALAIQHINLNAALLGTVYLKHTRGSLLDRLDKHREELRYYDYDDSLSFLPVKEAWQAVEEDKGTNKWHQTALMRMDLVEWPKKVK